MGMASNPGTIVALRQVAIATGLPFVVFERPIHFVPVIEPSGIQDFVDKTRGPVCIFLVVLLAESFNDSVNHPAVTPGHWKRHSIVVRYRSSRPSSVRCWKSFPIAAVKTG